VRRGESQHLLTGRRQDARTTNSTNQTDDDSGVGQRGQGSQAEAHIHSHGWQQHQRRRGAIGRQADREQQAGDQRQCHRDVGGVVARGGSRQSEDGRHSGERHREGIAVLAAAPL
jgi:hypothetical protein